MANFNTHLAFGAVASGLAATVAMAAAVVPPSHLLTLTIAGIVGSVLPDLDLEKATPSRMLFGGLGVVLAFGVLFQFTKQYSIVELWLVWLSVYCAMRYGVYWIFHKRTAHRGIFHSLLAGLFFMALTAVTFDKLFRETPSIAWFAGLFVFFGYVVHLLLDEIYSVDFEGKRIKRSFGSALKLFDYNSLRPSAAMAAALVIVLLAAPSAQAFLDVVGSQEIWAFLRERLWPHNGWFQLRMAEAAGAIRP